MSGSAWIDVGNQGLPQVFVPIKLLAQSVQVHPYTLTASMKGLPQVFFQLALEHPYIRQWDN